MVVIKSQSLQKARAAGNPGGLSAQVMEVFQEMVFKGCERSVITYSSLISACEKAGQWELALELFNEMHHEGCFPNTVTFNSLITACAQGRLSLPSFRRLWHILLAGSVSPGFTDFSVGEPFSLRLWPPVTLNRSWMLRDEGCARSSMTLSPSFLGRP